MNPFRPPVAKAAIKDGRDDRSYPQIGDLFGAAYVALTVVITMASGRFGMAPILILYALWLPRFSFKGKIILAPTKDVFWMATFAGFCLLSTVWSDYRSVTLRAALEFASMLACVVIISRTVSIEAMIKGLMVGATLVLLPVFVMGVEGLSGFLGSKNQMGLIAEIGFYASLIYALTKTRRFRRMIFSFAPFCLCALCLVFSRSAGSVVSIAVVFIVTVTAYFLSKMPRGWRPWLLLITGILVVVITAAGYSLNLQDRLFESLGKNSSLTGRTYLWSEGISNGLRHPFLGDGFSAFWVPGRPEAENYWFKFFIPGKMGFHFHNLYIQCFVDLGIVGLLLIGMITILNCARSVRYIMRHGVDLQGMFCLGFGFMFMIRGFVEVDFIEPYSIGTFMFYAILPRLGLALKAKSAPPIPQPESQLSRPFRFPAQSALAQKNLS